MSRAALVDTIALIDEQTVAMQAALIAKRNDVRRRMRATMDTSQLRALGNYERDLTDAIADAYPTDHWWFWKQQSEHL